MTITTTQAYSWRAQFSSVFVPQIEFYSDIWRQRLLAAITPEVLEKEAQDVYEREFGLRSSNADPRLDEADIADQAHEIAEAYFEPLASVRQGLLNVCAVSLYHLLEQQALIFFREGLASTCEIGGSLDHVKIKLANDCRVRISELPSWPQIELLRDLSNCVKHAEAILPGSETIQNREWRVPGEKPRKRPLGEACKRLRSKRPDWFTPIGPPVGRPHVLQPLYGQGIYLDETTLWEFATATKSFWNELGDALVQISE